MTFFHMHGAQS